MVLEKMGCVTMTKKRFLFYFYILLFFVCFILVQRFHHNVPKLAIPSSRKSANLSKSDTNILHTTKLPLKITKKKSTHLSKTTEFPLICPLTNTNQTCPTNNYPTTMDDDDDDDEQEIISTLESCPDYFRWIHEDLKPWKTKGITKEMVEAGKSTAHFRLVILDGRIYVEKYKRAYQTRDVTTIWGFLQLLRLYPGKLPDLDLMFNCDDKPVIKKSDYEAAVNPNPNPIPMFHYCGDDEHLDIPFPDWSFWGWHEVNIKPWELQLEEIKKGNENVKWVDRLPNAYWKGNLQTGNRIYLNKCNSSRKWNTEIYEQHWALEVKHGFRESNIADQCNYRYKIYMEGKAWSTSEKYIQACDSMLLLVQPRYYEFFTRGLLPLTHYWPINPSKLCESLKFAVKWGNKNPNKPSLAATRLMRKTLPSSASNEIIKQTVFPLQCITGTNDSTIQTCPSNYPTTFNPIDPTTRTCPDYLKWIHEDLQPWRSSGITKEMVEAAKEVAFFRLVVVDGKVYWEKYRDSYQTRDVFTIWGILQLLRLYPGKLPDFDIMFGAGDVPIIHKSNYTNPSDAPPFFHYCGDDQTLDIAFPDWSFWGW